jgi:hypothetical protein
MYKDSTFYCILIIIFFQHFRLREDVTMPQNRANMSVVVKMASTLRDGVLYQSHVASHRNQVGLLQILTKTQAIAFLEWFSLNKVRCSKLLGLGDISLIRQTNNTSIHIGGGGLESVDTAVKEDGKERSPTLKSSDSLNDICKQLNQAMMIAKSEL